MTHGQAAIRGEINKKILEVKKLILSLREQCKPVEPDRAIGRLTRMDAIQQKNMAEANSRSAEERLMMLQETLFKIGESDFGICNRCKKNIPLERIMAIPETRLCVSCAERP